MPGQCAQVPLYAKCVYIACIMLEHTLTRAMPDSRMLDGEALTAVLVSSSAIIPVLRTSRMHKMGTHVATRATSHKENNAYRTHVAIPARTPHRVITTVR
jgi:hypothetical protein